MIAPQATRFSSLKVKVFFTVDVEVWCAGWNDLDTCFPSAFRRYIYGPTTRGQYGLPRILEQLNAYGLHGVFFTEPLFSARFGAGPLQEIVGLINEARQEIQLHLHTEWVSETSPPLVDGVAGRRQHLCHFASEQQVQLLGIGLDLLKGAGAPAINAFRAGSFGIDATTWKSLNSVGIAFDSSYNGMNMPDSSLLTRFGSMHQPCRIDGVWEYPLSLFIGASGRVRHAQLGACSFRELEWLLWHAAEQQWESVVILAHNFELLNQAKTSVDPIVDARFTRLCRFLERNSDAFETAGFRDLAPRTAEHAPKLPRSTPQLTAGRWLEQGWRRVYG